MVESEILLLAIVNMAEGIRSLIGEKGAKAVMLDAGKQAGPKFLESLIGHFPEVLSGEEALKRSCAILEDLGFAKTIKIEKGRVILEEDVFTNAIEDNNLLNSPVIYFLAGLIEGFVSFMSEDRLILTPEEVQKGKIIYGYTL